MSLKATNSLLSRNWTPTIVSQPFSSGKQVLVSSDEKSIFTLLDNTITHINVSDPTIINSLTLNGSDEVTVFCLHPDNDEIVYSNQLFALSFWKLSENRCLRTLKAHTMPITALSYNSNGTIVASGSSDKSIRVWDVLRGHCTHCFKGGDVVRNVYFHPNPDSNLLFFVCANSTTSVVNLNSSAIVEVFKTHVGLPSRLDFHVTSNTMVSSGEDKILCFYDLNTLEVSKILPVYEELSSVTILNTSDSMLFCDEVPSTSFVLITFGRFGCLKFYLYNAKYSKIELLMEFPLHKISNPESESNCVKCAMYLPTTHSVLTVSGDCNFQFYDLMHIAKCKSSETTVLSNLSMIGNFGDILDLGIIPTLSSEIKLAVVTNCSQVRILKDKVSFGTLEGHRDIVLSIDVSPDGLWIVTSSKDQTCRVWSVPLESCAAVCVGHADSIGTVCVSSDLAIGNKKLCFVSGSGDRTLKRWIFNTETVNILNPIDLSPSHSIRAHEKDINSTCFSPDGLLIASASHDKSVKLWNANNLSLVATLRGHKRGVWKILFSPIDKILASCSGDKTVKLWSLSDFTILRTLEGHSASVLSISFLKSGHQLIAGTADGLMKLWNVRSGECVNTFDSHDDRVWVLKTNVSKDEFYSAGSDSKLLLWYDTTEQEESARILANEDKIKFEQNYYNSLKSFDFEKCLIMALSLNQSSKILNILKEIVRSVNGKIILEGIVSRLNVDQLKIVCSYVKEWNTSAKNSFITQTFLNCLLRRVSVEELEVESVTGLVSYSERHFQRIDRLQTSTFMLDYVASSMEIMQDSDGRPFKSSRKK